MDATTTVEGGCGKDVWMPEYAKDLPPAPPVLGGVCPYLTVDGAGKAADFYVRAFGATKVAHHPEDEQGRTMHVHLVINGGSLMLADYYAEYGQTKVPHQGYNLLLHVDDVQAWWDRAVAAGAEVLHPLEDMFWGDRYGQLRDPFGVTWALAAPSK